MTHETVNTAAIRQRLLNSGIISSNAGENELEIARRSCAEGEGGTGPECPLEKNCIVYGGSKNIVLIGMPGCGKSTVGRRLAKEYGFTFVDADAEFTSKYQMTAAECICSEGEKGFRRRETDVLKGFAADKRMCIATGGGVVTVPENREILKNLGFIVYLKRDLEKLAVKGRPISAEKGVERLFEERKAFYTSWADCSVSNDNLPETVCKIMQKYCENN